MKYNSKKVNSHKSMPSRGRWTIIRREDETVYSTTGEYLGIERPHDTGCIVTFVHSGEDIASELRQLSPGETSASEAGWQQGFDLMEAAWLGLDKST